MKRVALVTGGTRGLGLALVEGLVAEMAADDVVYLTGRDRERTAALAAKLSGDGARLWGEHLDVADEASVKTMAATLAERHGGVDIVFSNAYRRVYPDDDPAEVIDRYVAANNFGTTRVLRELTPLLRDGGRFLVVASTMGTLHYLAPVFHDLFDEPQSLDQVDRSVGIWRDAVRDRKAAGQGWPAWINAPSKVAQVAAVRAVARQRRPSDRERGIFVASVCPGLIDTDASRPWLLDMARAQTPAEAARPLLDLALGPAPDPALYGELVRFGQLLPWRP